MQNTLVKKWSVLGIALMAVSALTAAIVPSKADSRQTLNGNCKSPDTANSPATCTVQIAVNATCDRTGAGQGATALSQTDAPTLNTTVTINDGVEGTGCTA